MGVGRGGPGVSAVSQSPAAFGSPFSGGTGGSWTRPYGGGRYTRSKASPLGGGAERSEAEGVKMAEGSKTAARKREEREP